MLNRTRVFYNKPKISHKCGSNVSVSGKLNNAHSLQSVNNVGAVSSMNSFNSKYSKSFHNTTKRKEIYKDLVVDVLLMEHIKRKKKKEGN